MYYTREPITLSVLSAKEGYNLVIKNTKNHDEESYIVPSVSIINFNGAIFYRSLLDRDFLLPVSDYSVVEKKQVKLNVKLATKKNEDSKQPKRTSKTKSTKESRQQKPKKQKNTETQSKTVETTSEDVTNKKNDMPSHEEKAESNTKTKKPAILPPPTSLVEVKKHNKESDKEDASSENRTHTS